MDNNKKFIIRQLKLYIFWFVVLLPITIYIRKSWFDDGIIAGIFTTIKQLLFSSTFKASWFITAMITATCIVAALSEKINKYFLFLLFFIIYVICCLSSSYYSLFQNTIIIKEIYSTYVSVFTSPVFSFPSALIWVYIGKMYSENTKKVNMKLLATLTIICTILLFFEWKFVFDLTGKLNNDCYVFLVPLAASLFGIVNNINIKIRHAKMLRKISTITYPLHGSLAIIVSNILRLFVKK